MSRLKTGDIVVAKDGTVAAMWAEGRQGVIIGTVMGEDCIYGSFGHDLVEWGGDGLRLGFRHDEVIKVEEL